MRGPKAQASGMCHTCRRGRNRPAVRVLGQDYGVVPDGWRCAIKSQDRTSCATVLDPALSWHAEAMAKAWYMADDAEEVARLRGHVTGMLVPDVDPGTYVGVCRQCGGYVVVDLIECDEPYGLAYTQDCPQTPYHPAIRRNLLDYAPATASASHEPADRDPMYILED